MELEDPAPLVVEHTHRAVITVYSNGKANVVSLRVQWFPDVDAEEIKNIGYLPAAYSFVQDYIHPAIEKALMDYEVTPMLTLESPSERIN